MVQIKITWSYVYDMYAYHHGLLKSSAVDIWGYKKGINIQIASVFVTSVTGGSYKKSTLHEYCTWDKYMSLELPWEQGSWG